MKTKQPFFATLFSRFLGHRLTRLGAMLCAALLLAACHPEVTDIGLTTATVTAASDGNDPFFGVEDNGVAIQYGTDLNYGTTVQSSEAFLTGLSPGTTYHVRTVAFAGAEVQYSDDVTFTTLKPKVAIIGAPGEDDWNVDVQGKVSATGLFSQVDSILVSNGHASPTLAELQAYDAVMVYSDGDFSHPVALGDVLADYVDSGKGVVLATFIFEDYLGGRLASDDYFPFTSGDQGGGSGLTLVKDLPADPILKGVNSFDGGGSGYQADVSLTADSTLIAHWSNGVPLVARKSLATGRVVGLNFYPPSSDAGGGFWDSSTDGARLMANALLAAVTETSVNNTAPTAPDGTANATTGDATTITVAFPDTDADGNTVTMTDASGPHLSSVSINGHNVTFTPDSNYAGDTDLSYTVDDGSGAPNATATGTITVTIADNDKPVISPITDVIAYAQSPAGAVVNYPAAVVNDAVDPTPVVTYSQDSGTFFALNVPTNINVTATDATGNKQTASFKVTVTPAPIVTTPVYQSKRIGGGDVVPGGGGAKFVDFSSPAINDAGKVAFSATSTTGASLIFDGTTVRAKTGDVAADLPGTFYATFTDPAINASGNVAFVGNLRSAVPADMALFTNLGGVMHRVARRLDFPANAGGAQIERISGFALTDNTVFYSVQFVPGPGGVTGSNSLALYAWTPVGGSRLVLRNGSAFGGSTVQSFTALTCAGLSPGQGRSAQGNQVLARVTLNNSSVGIYAFTPGVTGVVAKSGDIAPGVPLPKGTDKMLFTARGFGVPIANSSGGSAFVGSFAGKTSNLSTNVGMFADIGADLKPVLRIRDALPAGGLGTLGGFADPVYNATDDLATVVVVTDGLIGGASQAIVFKPHDGPAVTLAQVGAPAAGINASWAAFQSVALPSGARPLFLATLAFNGQIDGTNNQGIWAMDNAGLLRLVVRTGDLINGKRIRTLTALYPVNFSPDQSRSFNNNHQIVYRVTFSDSTQALVTAVIP